MPQSLRCARLWYLRWLCQRFEARRKLACLRPQLWLSWRTVYKRVWPCFAGTTRESSRCGSGAQSPNTRICEAIEQLCSEELCFTCRIDDRLARSVCTPPVCMFCDRYEKTSICIWHTINRFSAVCRIVICVPDAHDTVLNAAHHPSSRPLRD